MIIGRRIMAGRGTGKNTVLQPFSCSHLHPTLGTAKKSEPLGQWLVSLHKAMVVIYWKDLDLCGVEICISITEHDTQKPCTSLELMSSSWFLITVRDTQKLAVPSRGSSFSSWTLWLLSLSLVTYLHMLELIILLVGFDVVWQIDNCNSEFVPICSESLSHQQCRIRACKN